MLLKEVLVPLLFVIGCIERNSESRHFLSYSHRHFAFRTFDIKRLYPVSNPLLLLDIALQSYARGGVVSKSSVIYVCGGGGTSVGNNEEE